jgi:putative methionine-R-sulfoxide reductase with GAF domain
VIKLIDLINEEKMTPAQKKKRGEIYDKLTADGMSSKKAGPIATSKAMSEKKGIDRDKDGDIDSEDWRIGRDIAIKAKSKKVNEENIPAPLASLYDLVEKLIAQDITKDEILRIVNFATAKLNEGSDHEVSMAVSSLEAIAKAIIELRQKLGNVERNIPGWIQDHVAKAENYIEQAAQGFHELKDDEMNETKRMQQLAGMLNENDQPGIYFDIEQDLMHGEFESIDDQVNYLQDVINFCNDKIAELQANG